MKRLVLSVLLGVIMTSAMTGCGEVIDPPVNRVPVVNTDYYMVVGQNVTSVTLNGTVTDDGLPNNRLSILWSQVTGFSGVLPEPLLDVTFSDPTILSPVVSGLKPGYSYTFKLSASDGDKDSYSVVYVTAEPEKQPPVAMAGMATILESSATSTVLEGSSIEDYGYRLSNKKLSFLWEQVRGPNIVLSDKTVKSPVVTGLTPGNVYVFRLTVSDGILSSTDHVVVRTMETVVDTPGIRFFSVDTESFFDEASSSVRELVWGMTKITYLAYGISVARVYIYLDGIVVASSQGGFSSVDVNFTGVQEGSHQITIIAVDGANNQWLAAKNVWVNNAWVGGEATKYLRSSRYYRATRFPESASSATSTTFVIPIVLDQSINDEYAWLMNARFWEHYTQNGDQKILFPIEREDTGMKTCEDGDGGLRGKVNVYKLDRPCRDNAIAAGGFIWDLDRPVPYLNPPVTHSVVAFYPEIFNRGTNPQYTDGVVGKIFNHEIGHAVFGFSHTQNRSVMDHGHNEPPASRGLSPSMKRAANCLYFKLKPGDPINCD